MGTFNIPVYVISDQILPLDMGRYNSPVYVISDQILPLDMGDKTVEYSYQWPDITIR